MKLSLLTISLTVLGATSTVFAQQEAGIFNKFESKFYTLLTTFINE